MDNNEDNTINIEDSILLTIKKYLGIESSIKHFDPDIIMCINSTLSILTQLGVGPDDGFSITSESDTWESLIGLNHQLNMIKNYIALKTRLIFDPPTISAVLKSYEEQIKEYEYRITCQTTIQNV